MLAKQAFYHFSHSASPPGSIFQQEFFLCLMFILKLVATILIFKTICSCVIPETLEINKQAVSWHYTESIKCVVETKSVTHSLGDTDSIALK
jgi:hypothetical protein